LACSGHHGGGHCAFDKWGIDKADMAIQLAFQQMSHSEDGAAQVGQHDNSLAAIGAPDGVANCVSARPERAVRSAARRLDPHLGSGYLGRQVGEAVRQLEAVGHQYNSDHSVILPV